MTRSLYQCKPKNNIVSEIDCSNFQAVQLGKSTRLLKLQLDKQRRSVENRNSEGTKMQDTFEKKVISLTNG